ncbi:hypothetical protein M5689_018523 [Euphorbia peplus]|nr:hypothetical protein M5689_018523 [Euphorbia peplus]
MPYCLLKSPLPWMFLVLGLSGIFFGYGFSSIILTSILTLSNLIFNFSKHKQTSPPPEKLVPQNDHQESSNSTSKLQALVEEENEKSENEHNDQNKEDEDGDGQSKIMVSESESQGRSSTSEDSEADYWQGNIFGSSDGSISDEDSLIEISLPSGVYIDHYNEELKEEKKKKLEDDFTTESFFKQQMSLVELLADLNEMNEEDNLIEIDLSMGSIKCPRFEIHA